jgi:cytochrome b561
MKKRILAEPSAFALALLTAMGAVALAMQFPRAPEAHSGPGSFPVFLGIVLAVLALCGLVQSLRKGAPEKVAVTDPAARSHMLLLGGATVLYLLLMPLLGFISATTLLCMAVLVIQGYRNPVRALAAGFIAAFALYGIFGLLMNVVLPKGWIG